MDGADGGVFLLSGTAIHDDRVVRPTAFRLRQLAPGATLKVGEDVDIKLPKGIVRYRILSIEYIE